MGVNAVTIFSRWELDYLDKVVKMESIIIGSSLLGKIKIINDLRNHLMHYNGCLSEKRDDLGCGEKSIENRLNIYHKELKVRISSSNVIITYDSAMNIIKYIETFLEFIYRLRFKDSRRRL